jgi:hypothetical protein
MCESWQSDFRGNILLQDGISYFVGVTVRRTFAGEEYLAIYIWRFTCGQICRWWVSRQGGEIQLAEFRGVARGLQFAPQPADQFVRSRGSAECICSAADGQNVHSNQGARVAILGGTQLLPVLG